MKKNPTVDTERLVLALEELVRDYRAGRGDVLSRMAEGRNAHSTGTLSLSSILTLALFGEAGFPKFPHDSDQPTYPDCHGVMCNKVEYLSLLDIGSGSAQKGAALLVSAALRWISSDRAGVIAWATRALPKLQSHETDTSEHGLFGTELWQIPVAGDWWTGPQEVAGAVKGPRIYGADDLIRAMSLSWHQDEFRALVTGTDSQSLLGSARVTRSASRRSVRREAVAA